MSIQKQIALERSLETFKYTLGYDINRFLEDPDVQEIQVNADGSVWIDKKSVYGRTKTDVVISKDLARQVIYQVASLTNQVCSPNNPSIAGELPDGSRFQGEIPPICKAPFFVIRKHNPFVLSLEDYLRDGILKENQYLALMEAIKAKKNIIAAGGTKSGKTTFLNAILNEISKTGDRIVTIEDTYELQCKADNHVALKTSEHRTMDDLLKDALRLTPDRIVVGEVRSGEALTLLDAWNTGHDGGCSTVHSSSAFQTLQRLEQMVSRVSMTPQQHTIAGAVDIVVYIRLKGKSRVVEDVLLIEGYNEKEKQYIITKLA